MTKTVNPTCTLQDNRLSDVLRSCDGCTARSRAICADLTREELSALNAISRRRQLSAGQPIISDQEQPEYFAIILSGTVKQTKVLPDGRQQIVGLLFPSDFVGWPFETHGSLHAEAATPVQLCSFPAQPFEKLVRQHPGIQHHLFRYALSQLDAAQDWMLLLGRKTAREKVASLFTMIAKRSRGPDTCDFDSQGRERFALPLNRSDTADFLGLTLETVSRQFRVLKDNGVIRLDGPRMVTILDAPALDATATSPFV